MALLPKVKLKAIVSFPASVLDGVGVDVVKQNGTYKFNIAFDDFAPPVGGVTDPSNQTALLWNSVTGEYSLVPIDVIATGGSVPEAPNDGILYGRKSLNWVNAWASPVLTGNPTAPTPAPGDSDTSIATTAFVTTAVAGVPTGIHEAPNDGVQYGRQSLGWTPISGGGGGSGDVTGPSGSVTNRIAVFNGTTGKIIQDGGKTVTDLAHNEIWLEDFGADPTGATSSEAAINNWLAQAGNGKCLRFGPGVFTFSTAKTIAVVDRFEIIGAGRDISKLLYIGANTTNDLFTFGTTSSTSDNCVFKDFTVSSSTVMTGGYAMRFKGLSNSYLRSVNIDGQNGTHNFWHGIYFDGVQIVRYENFDSCAQRDIVSVSGTVGGGPKAECFIKDGWLLGLSSSCVGVRVGGAFGGAYLDYLSASGLFAACYVVDQTLKAEVNREFFMSNCVADAGVIYAFLLNDSAAGSGTFQYTDCTFYSQVRLMAGPITNHQFTGCRFSCNAGGDCLRVDDIMLVYVEGSFLINSQSGYGLNLTVPGNVWLGHNVFAGNSLGNYAKTNWPVFLGAEYVEGTVLSTAPVSLSSGTAQNLTSIVLTSGEWDVRAVVGFLPVSSSNVSRLLASMSTTSAGLDATPGHLVEAPLPAAGVVMNSGLGPSPSLVMPPSRFRVAANTTVYLVVDAYFTVAGVSAWGSISARKVG